jgi:hypothetical protein
MILVGAAIFAWMAASGKLDLAQIAKGFAHWPLTQVPQLEE